MKGTMYHTSTVTGELTAATRLRNTFSGNAQWKLTVNGFSYKTYPNGARVSHTNFQDLVHTDISLRLNERGRVHDFFTPRILQVGSIVHLARHLEQLPIGSRVRATSGHQPEYVKLDLWRWMCGPVVISPEMLLTTARRLRVTHIGGQS